MILGSTNVSTLMLGSSAVQKVMLGSTEVWSAASYDADAQAWFNAVVAAGSSITDANKAAVSAFVAGCKTDGIWTAIKASCLLCAADSLAGALTPLVGPAPTNVGGNFVSGDYSRTAGLAGNGTNKHLNSNYNTNSDGQNDASLSVYVTAPLVSISRYYAGTPTNNNGGRQIYASSTTNIRFYCHAIGTASRTSAPLTDTGTLGVSRASSTEVTTERLNTTTTISNTSYSPVSENVFIFSNGSTGFANCPISFYHIGANLNLSLLRARLNTLMAALT